MRASRRTRVLALLACVAVLATSVAYAVLLQQQGSEIGGAQVGLLDALRGAPSWVLVVLAATSAADAAAVWLPPGQVRRGLLYATALVLTLVGFLAIFSIGVALLVAAGLTIAAAVGEGSRGPATSGSKPRMGGDDRARRPSIGAPSEPGRFQGG